MDEKTIYKLHQLGKTLGLEQSVIEEIVKEKNNGFSLKSSLYNSDSYKYAGKYGSISPVDLYKDPTGGMYGTISLRDFQ